MPNLRKIPIRVINNVNVCIIAVGYNNNNNK